MLRKLGITVLAMGLLITGIVHADVSEEINALPSANSVVYVTDGDTDNSTIELKWEDEEAYLIENKVSEENRAILKTLFEAADTEETWDAYFTKLDEILPMTLPIEEEKEMFKAMGVSAEDMIKLEAIYNQITALESAGDTAGVDKQWDAYEKILKKYGTTEASFDIEKGFLKSLNATDADIVALEKLFTDAVKLEKEGKYEDADKLWAEYDTLMSKYIDNVKEDFTWETLEESFSSLSDDVVAELKTAFDSALALEKEGKNEEADTAWDIYYNLVDQHVKN